MIFKETLTFKLSISIFGLIFLILSVPKIMSLALEKKGRQVFSFRVFILKEHRKNNLKNNFSHGKVVLQQTKGLPQAVTKQCQSVPEM